MDIPWQNFGYNRTKALELAYKKTDFLLCGENPGSKFKKAESLNINIINEIQFKELIK